MGESLKDVIRRAHGEVATRALPATAEEKIHPNYVLPRHLAWMQLPEERRAWSPEAVQFAYDVLAGKYKKPRDRRISPSSLGDHCERLLLFGFGGWPKEPFPIPNAEKMAAGEFHHLRWQMEGLSAGYMDMGEAWVHSEALRCGGSGDGRLADGSLFELKSTASHLFDALRNQRGSALNYVMGMHTKHKLQMEAYWLVDEVSAAEQGRPRLLTDWGSLVYQDAGDPQKLLEFRLHSSPSRRAEVHRILEGLHDWIDLNQLPDMLDACRKAHFGTVGSEVITDKEQVIYARCPYRRSCPTATRVFPLEITA